MLEIVKELKDLRKAYAKLSYEVIELREYKKRSELRIKLLKEKINELENKKKKDDKELEGQTNIYEFLN